MRRPDFISLVCSCADSSYYNRDAQAQLTFCFFEGLKLNLPGWRSFPASIFSLWKKGHATCVSQRPIAHKPFNRETWTEIDVGHKTALYPFFFKKNGPLILITRSQRTFFFFAKSAYPQNRLRVTARGRGCWVGTGAQHDVSGASETGGARPADRVGVVAT